MSYSLDLNRVCDHKVIQEDKIVEDDVLSVILNRPLNNTTDITVRLNDFKRDPNFLTEIITKDDVSDQFTITNTDTITVKNIPIYNGLKIGQLATLKEQVTVRINVVEEDVTGQFTGTENYFIVQGKPLLQANEFDYTLATIDDVVVYRNGIPLSYIQTTCVNSETYNLTNGSKLSISVGGSPVQFATFYTTDFIDITQATAAEVVKVLITDWPSVTPFVQSGKIVIRANTSFTISDGIGNPNVQFGFSTLPIINDGTNVITEIDAKIGRIQLSFIPAITDTIKVTYYFRASIKDLNAYDGIIVLKQKPVIGQEVKVAYYTRVNDGWYLKDSTRSMITGAKDVVFYRPKNTERSLAIKENVSSQFTGNENYFQVAHFPILPLYQQFGNTFKETLYNSMTVWINGDKVQIMRMDAQYGLVALYVRPQPDDIVECTYYYETKTIPDRVTVDYSVDKVYCQKCAQHGLLWDYVIDVLGNYSYVKDEYKLKQDLKKIVVTEKGSDQVALWYGTSFEKIIGKKLLPDYAKTRISGEIVEALSKLKNAQIKQQDYQEVTDREFLDFVQSLTVTQDSIDPTFYIASVDVVTQAGTSFEAVQPLKG